MERFDKCNKYRFFLFFLIVGSFFFIVMKRSADIADDFEGYANGLFGSLVQAVQQANTLPKSDDLSFYRMLNRPLGTTLDNCSGDILDLCNTLLQYVGRPPSDPFEEVEDVRERFGDVVDAVDSLLEKAVCINKKIV
jgi:hypothetical protein